MPKEDLEPTTKCPLCNRPLASEEYLKAKKELENKIQSEYDVKNKEKDSEFRRQLKELKDQHERDTQNHQNNHEEQIKKLQQDLEKSHQSQLSILEKNYGKLSTQNQKQFKILEKQLEMNHKQEIQSKNKQLATLKNQLKQSHDEEIREKNKQIKQLQMERSEFEKRIKSNIQADFEMKSRHLNEDLREKEVQIKRFSDEIESLKKQLVQSQSELKGEAGELDLYSTLTHAFSDDYFRRQTRGTSGGDLIQQIRTSSGPLDTPIVYDNKAASTVTKSDIEKAKKYKKIHGTNYVLIVSNNLPKKTIPNGFFGETEGILLVHTSIVVEIVRQIRIGIVEISKLTKSKEDQKAKQSKLYEYIISREFTSVMESLSETSEKLFNLQNKEEKDHQILWKTRKELQDQLTRTYADLSSGIESITQKDAYLEEKEISG